MDVTELNEAGDEGSDVGIGGGFSDVGVGGGGSDVGGAGTDVVRDLMPPDFEYKIVTCQVLDVSENSLKFDLEVRVDVKTEAEVKLFLSSFNTSSGCSFNLQGGRADKRQAAGGRSLSQVRGFRKCCLKLTSPRLARTNSQARTQNVRQP